MSLKSFVIKETDGLNFAKLSGDKNSIHLNKITGYNSIYGYSIPHGVLVILKFFEKNSSLKNLKTKINILRIPMINTRQNLSLLDRNLPDFRNLLSSNKEIAKKVFFED